MLDISLIIPANNEEAQIGACLESAIRNSRGKFKEILVIDNASTDRTAAIARSYQGVRVICEPRKGLTRARQCGFDNATGDILAYIDADTRLPENWVDVVEQTFATRADAVSLSGSARYFDADGWERFALLLGWWLSAPLAYRFTGYMIFGAHFAARRTALANIGGFNQSIDFYGEDTDLARRLATQGKTIFRMDFFIYTSARRFQNEGIMRAFFLYGMNFIWPVLFSRPFTTSYRDIRVSPLAKSDRR
ncbi:glycosyltransferase [Methylocapsa polymorpha]|uniref:Glycosyltransferase n=1 Tax=Methylocapsa polymorpha TaxID=3080828 RepID=A0ABZ0HLV5_9HYPH|nr:glycosyltransferase [Methylocapsa sp. RX1]